MNEGYKESAMVKMQRERLDQLCLDKEKLQAKCERYEKALKVFAESDKCTLELLTYHSMSGRNIRREVHDGKQFAIEALNEGGIAVVDKDEIIEAVHSLSLANFDQSITTTKKQILEHLIKELGL